MGEPGGNRHEPEQAEQQPGGQRPGQRAVDQSTDDCRQAEHHDDHCGPGHLTGFPERGDDGEVNATEQRRCANATVSAAIILAPSHCLRGGRSAATPSSSARIGGLSTAIPTPRLVRVLAAVRAGLGVAALMPANLEPVMICRDTNALPVLPDVGFGLARHPRTAGDPLIDAVETVLRRIV
ncbi:hypothetical protein ACGFIW_04220 [Micromonospora sp. NPDC048935]|uniref:hypothetical protein n=1 Tax=Micromonospora sp. NPDC048935 TaxID=3364262 RepID=UPI003720AE44